MPKSESKTANEQRAARALRFCPGKTDAVVSIWADSSQMIGLCDLAYSANNLKAVTTHIENTINEEEIKTATEFKTNINLLIQADKNGITWKYQNMIQLIKEYQKDTNKQTVSRSTVYKGEKLGVWVNTQRTAYRRGLLGIQNVNLCRSVGIQLEIIHSKAMDVDQVFELLSYCKESKIRIFNNMEKIQYKNEIVDPSEKLHYLRKKWHKLTSIQKKNFESIGIMGQSDVFDKEFQIALDAWTKVSEHGAVTKANIKEYNWQNNQRQAYKMKGRSRAKMTPDRIEKLNAVGFKWSG